MKDWEAHSAGYRAYMNWYHSSPDVPEGLSEFARREWIDGFNEAMETVEETDHD